MSTITALNQTDNGDVSRGVINTNFSNLNTDKIETSVIDTDGTLAANSDVKIPSQKAVKTYAAPNSEHLSGWIPSEAATYVSQDGSTGVFNIASDVTGKYSPGMRYKYQQSQALTAYWNFDANSNSQVGSFNGTDTAMTYTAGKFGNAATFNGTTSKIVIADNAALKPTGEFTIGCWIKTNNTGAVKTIFQTSSANTNIAGLALAINNNNAIVITLGNNTGSTAGINYSQQTGTTNVCDNIYHYIVWSYRNNYSQLYVDGKLEFSLYTLTPSYAATNYVRVGCQNNTGTDITFMNGQIDDLFLINGYALDQATILAQYNASAAQGTGNITVKKYGLITAVGAYSGGNTPITIWGGTDYSLQNAAISSPYYATVQNPFGFNKNPYKWTVELSDVVQRSKTTPTQNVWDNTGGLFIDVPIGKWKLQQNSLSGVTGANTTGFQTCDIYTTLSTGSNTESDPEITTGDFMAATTTASSLVNLYNNFSEKYIETSVKTRYYMNIKTAIASMANISIYGSAKKTIIRAVSTLL